MQKLTDLIKTLFQAVCKARAASILVRQGLEEKARRLYQK